jgi:hypothetical protein
MEERNGHTTTNGKPPSPPPSDGGPGGDHDHSGRFTRGNRSGLGSRFKANNKAAVGSGGSFLRDLARIRTTFFRCLTDERIAEVVDALVTMVKEKNLAALEVLRKLYLGPELPYSVDPDAVDLIELERLRAQGQADAMGNSRLSPQIALAIEKVYADLAAAEAVALFTWFFGKTEPGPVYLLLFPGGLLLVLGVGPILFYRACRILQVPGVEGTSTISAQEPGQGSG